MKKFIIHSVEELPGISEHIIELLNSSKVVLFQGDLGAGKTLLVKNICLKMDVTDTVNSPTFSLVNEYTTRQGKTIYHIDLYRIDTEEELLDIGFEEYLFSPHFCFIEWPEKAGSLIPDGFTKVQINKISETAREITIFPAGILKV